MMNDKGEFIMARKDQRDPGKITKEVLDFMSDAFQHVTLERYSIKTQPEIEEAEFEVIETRSLDAQILITNTQ